MPSGFVTPAGGGGGLPAGWTADASNPANVNTNGGFMRFGPGSGDGGVLLPNAGLIFTDSNVGLEADGDLALLGQNLTGAATVFATAVNSSGDVAAGGIVSTNVNAPGAGTNVELAGQTTISPTTIGFFGAAPATRPAAPVTLGDVIAGLQALGLFAT